MNELVVIEEAITGERTSIMKSLKNIFYSHKKYVNIVEHFVKKGSLGKSYYQKLEKVYKYIGHEQKRKLILRLKLIFDFIGINKSLNQIENIDLNVLLSSWIDKNDLEE